MAMTVTIRLPTIRVMIPYWPRRGNQPAASGPITVDQSTSVMKVQASRNNEPMISALTTTEKKPAHHSAMCTPFSVRCRRGSPRRSSTVSCDIDRPSFCVPDGDRSGRDGA